MQMSSDLAGIGMSQQDLVLIHRLTERHGVEGMLVAIAAYLEESGDIPDPVGFVQASASGITMKQVYELMEEFNDFDEIEPEGA